MPGGPRAYAATLPSPSGGNFSYNSALPFAWTILSDVNEPGDRLIKLRYAGGASDQVPALLVEPLKADKAHPVPCVLIIHGLGGQKEQMLPIARIAAQQGYASLLIDLPGFGERKIAPPKLGSAGQLDAYLTDEFSRSVTDLRRGIDYLAVRPEIDSSRLAEIGVSLGGFIGVDLAAVDPRVKAVALIASGGGLGEILTAQAKSRVSFGAQYAPVILRSSPSALDRQLAAVDPLTNVARIAPRPLLMENGGSDPIVPPSAARRLYAAAAEPKHIDWYPGQGHIPSPIALYGALTAFLQQNLASASEPAPKRVGAAQ